MSYEIPGFTRSYEALVDLSASQFKFVKLSGVNIVAVAAATDGAVGVLQNKPNSAGVGVFQSGNNSAGTVMVDGVTRVKAAAAIAAGVAVYLDATGQVTTTVQAGHCVGLTETATANAGELLSLLLKPLGSLGAMA